MKYPKMKTFLWLAILLSPSCAKVGRNSNLKDILPLSEGGIEPRLGDSYDSLIQEVRSSASCVSGETSKLTSARGSIAINQSLDSERLMQEFTGEVRGTPRSVLLELGAAGGYYRSINRNASALNLLYTVKVDQGGERLSQVALLSDMKKLNSSEIFERCGDHYISQISRGGLLTIAISIDFADQNIRKKWQSQLKLNGTWGDLSKDLNNKIDNGGIDSTMTIKVVQVGGSPSQALLATKSCSLSTTEEFQACKQRMDDLMAYASTSFPQQLEGNPAILQYTTASLQNLGVKNIATLDQDILDIRRDLESLNLVATTQADNLAKAQQVGLEFEPTLVGAINNNRKEIKEAAKACFTYTYNKKGVDWSNCRSASQSIRTKLAKVEMVKTEVHEAVVPANSSWGAMIVNSYGVPMQVQYVVESNRKWTIEPGVSLDVAGQDSNGLGAKTSDAFSPEAYRGALLRGIENRYELAETNGQINLPPGAAAPFVMNDTLGKYDNNSGSQKVFWRCVSCLDSQPRLVTDRVRVPSNRVDGAVYRSRVGAKGSYRATAYGRWRSGFMANISGPSGINKQCGNSCPAPTENVQALVMQDLSQSPVTLVGSENALRFDSDDSVTFMTNDTNQGYGDNVGGVEVILQCYACKEPAP